jgi:hypothetical protein
MRTSPVLSFALLLLAASVLYAQSQRQDTAKDRAAGPSSAQGDTSSASTAPVPSKAEAASDVDHMPLNGDNLQPSQFLLPPGLRSQLEKRAEEARASEQQRSDATCYAMRSYKVARDEKGSDSTHPVAYSTCQPASRIHTYSINEAKPPLVR